MKTNFVFILALYGMENSKYVVYALPRAAKVIKSENSGATTQ